LNTNTIGLISGLLVIVSAIPYGIGVYRGKITPNLTSWSLWSLIGLALWLTYKSSGAEANVWPAVFGFTNPFVITLIILYKHGWWTKPNRIDIFCLLFGLLSLGIWLMVRESRELSQYALYIAIIADACAAVPTIMLVWIHPDADRPFAWTFFAIGYGLAIFAITEQTFANYILPVYMFFGALSIALPLVLYRWRKKLPLAEWV
jgi:hypothetical protein